MSLRTSSRAYSVEASFKLQRARKLGSTNTFSCSNTAVVKGRAPIPTIASLRPYHTLSVRVADQGRAHALEVQIEVRNLRRKEEDQVAAPQGQHQSGLHQDQVAAGELPDGHDKAGV